MVTIICIALPINYFIMALLATVICVIFCIQISNLDIVNSQSTNKVDTADRIEIIEQLLITTEKEDAEFVDILKDQ